MFDHRVIHDDHRGIVDIPNDHESKHLVYIGNWERLDLFYSLFRGSGFID